MSDGFDPHDETDFPQECPVGALPLGTQIVVKGERVGVIIPAAETNLWNRKNNCWHSATKKYDHSYVYVVESGELYSLYFETKMDVKIVGMCSEEQMLTHCCMYVRALHAVVYK